MEGRSPCCSSYSSWLVFWQDYRQSCTLTWHSPTKFNSARLQRAGTPRATWTSLTENVLHLFATRFGEDAEQIYVDVVELVEGSARPLTRVTQRSAPVPVDRRRDGLAEITQYLEDVGVPVPNGTSIEAWATTAENVLNCFCLLLGEQSEQIYVGIIELLQTMPLDNAPMTLDDGDLSSAFW